MSAGNDSRKRKKARSTLSRRKFLQGSGAAALGTLIGQSAAAQTSDEKIVSAKIHPAIGVARIGNSLEYFIGPETITPELTMAGQSRDEAGALKRQAARFRIFGYNAAGQAVRELTEKEARITWNVHVANRKAEWFRFIVAMDLPEAKDLSVIRRNASIKNRKSLVIDPGMKRISGVQTNSIELNGGKFMGLPVSLGELRTDEEGRLLFLSALGKAESPQNTAVFNPDDVDTFNNADGWYDDTCDGPVRASVWLNGKSLPVESAWVVVAPPNYAPNVIGWRTLYDLLQDTYISAGAIPTPQTTSFKNDIYPILRRLSGLQWVNKGIAVVHGKGQAIDFENPEFIKKLASGGISPADLQMRQGFYNLFRTLGQNALNGRLLPALYGDAYGFSQTSPSRNFIVNGTIALHLQRWAKGAFINDWSAENRSVLNAQEQASMLDRAALHFCLADAFHPGCELTWPMRHMSMYSSPFRIKTRKPGLRQPDYGPLMNNQNLFTANGPLNEQGPGDLTKWMAMPWQGDTVFCRSGYEPKFDPYILTYWPARVPNHVLSEADYRAVMDMSLPREQRLQIFNKRVFWVRNLKGSAAQQMLQMVREFGQMGVIEARPGIPDDQDFPAIMFVESLVDRDKMRNGQTATAPSLETAVNPESPAEQAGWKNEEELEEFRNIRFRRKKNP